MPDDFDQEDPFKKYGGKQITTQEDPFKKYGGTVIDTAIKKKFLFLQGLWELVQNFIRQVR